MKRKASAWFILVLSGWAGCQRAEPTIRDTGARQAARAYFDALVARDWPNSYSALTAECRQWLTEASFTQRASAYRSHLGFDPDKVAIRSCEEQGDRAVAHVILSGHRDGKTRQFKDALELRREPSGWAAVLPRTFGQFRR